MKHVRRTLFLIGLVVTATSVAAQDWYGLMQASESVRDHGFTNAGVAYIAPNSQSLNPGTLALISSGQYLSLSLYPVRARWDYFGDGTGFRSFGASLGLPLKTAGGREKFALGLAYTYHRFDLEQLLVYSQPGLPPEEVYPHDDAHNLTVAVAYRGSVQAGLGVTARHYRSVDLLGHGGLDASGPQFDFGGLLQKTFGRDPLGGRVSSNFKWSITPAAGVSFRNIGPDLTFIEGAEGDPPLKTMRAGLSLELKRWLGNVVAYSLTPMLEYEKILIRDESKYYHYAGEIGVLEIAYFRYGKVTANYSSLDQTAWGLTVSTRGLRRLLNGGGPAFLQKTDFDFSYAKYSEDGRYFLGGLKFMEAGLLYRF